MSEEKTNVDKTFNDFIGTKEYIDHINAEKSQWGETYKTDKLPSILDEARRVEREKTILELNPEETESDKRLRAIEQELKESKEKLVQNSLKEVLRTKAKEIGFDVLRAERYSIYGDKAEEAMASDHKYFSEFVTSEVEKNIKGNFDKKTPSKSDKQTEKLTVSELKGKSVAEIRQLKAAGLIEGL